MLTNYTSFRLDSADCPLVLLQGFPFITEAISLHLEGKSYAMWAWVGETLFFLSWTYGLSLWSLNSNWCTTQNGKSHCQNSQLPVLKASIQRSIPHVVSLKVCWAKTFSAKSEDYIPSVPVVDRNSCEGVCMDKYFTSFCWGNKGSSIICLNFFLLEYSWYIILCQSLLNS